MLKIEKTEVVGWEAAVRGMRNPLESWEKSDSYWNYHPCEECNGNASCIDDFHVSSNDLDLMTRLRNAGTDHRKFMRMLVVYVDITGPLYWWKEFDTYKVGTVANSCSTMHCIHKHEFTLDDFSHEHLIDYDLYACDESECVVLQGAPHIQCGGLQQLNLTINILNFYRRKYLETKSKPMKDEKARQALMKKYWWQMIQLLPSSYNQKRTVMMNYEVLANMYKSRRNHKLDEWHTFCDWIESLPYSELITGSESKKVLVMGNALSKGLQEGIESVQRTEENVGINDGLNKHYGGVEGRYSLCGKDQVSNIRTALMAIKDLATSRTDPRCCGKRTLSRKENG